MLVLSRKVREAIVVTKGGETIRIVVTALQGNKVKIGVQAPDDFNIYREELLDVEDSPPPTQ